jgi:hypothetical protein
MIPRPICYLAKCFKNGTNWNIDVKGYNLKLITCLENKELHNVEKSDENNLTINYGYIKCPSDLISFCQNTVQATYKCSGRGILISNQD